MIKIMIFLTLHCVCTLNSPKTPNNGAKCIIRQKWNFFDKYFLKHFDIKSNMQKLYHEIMTAKKFWIRPRKVFGSIVHPVIECALVQKTILQYFLCCTKWHVFDPTGTIAIQFLCQYSYKGLFSRKNPVNSNGFA